MSWRQWVRWPWGIGVSAETPPPAPSVRRVSRLLADARTVLGGPSAHRTLASLGKLMPMLRAAGATGEARALCLAGVRSEPQSAQLCNGHRAGLPQARLCLSSRFGVFFAQPSVSQATDCRTSCP